MYNRRVPDIIERNERNAVPTQVLVIATNEEAWDLNAERLKIRLGLRPSGSIPSPRRTTLRTIVPVIDR
jgi:hypothetical protein